LPVVADAVDSSLPVRSSALALPKLPAMNPNATPSPRAAGKLRSTWTLRESWHSWISNDMQRAGPGWLQWVWTLIFSAVLAVGFTLLGYVMFASKLPGSHTLQGWGYWYGKNFVVCFTIAALIHLMFEAGAWLLGGPPALRKLKDWQRSVFFGGIPLLGVAIGWPVGMVFSGSADMLPRLLGSTQSIALVTTFCLGTSLLLHFYFAAKAKQLAAEKRASEAQLRLLQGQIEPHFLFNTLANVQSLMDHDPPKAKQMLMSFTDYLRASLTTLRSASSAVAQELDLAQNYLQLLQARMEDRLQFSIDADEAARRQPLPPLLLQPLVENAVVHGLEPSIEGGTVRVSARVDGQHLVLEVQDDGRGLDAPARQGARAGAGMALSNIRERLLTRYGSAATLEVLAAHPGTLARITLPIEGSAA